ncbi:MAG: hypothetical protein ACJ74G_14855 [Blastocatellia bacterium]
MAHHWCLAQFHTSAFGCDQGHANAHGLPGRLINRNHCRPFTFEDAEYYRKAANDKKATADGGTLLFDPDAKAVRFLVKGSPQLDIPYDRVTSMLYERTAKPRYTLGLLVAWPLLFTKSKKHFLTIQYKGADGQGQFALIRLDKTNYLEALATTEAQTGVKVNRAEEK